MPGTQLAADGHLCEDIDECRTDNGGCSHSCLNTLGTAYCACPEGYMLTDDWKTCEGQFFLNGINDPFVFIYAKCWMLIKQTHFLC